MKPSISKNEFFNIKNLPNQEGIVLFPLSMSKLNNGSSPQELLKEAYYFLRKKIIYPTVGMNFVYGDFIYLYSNEKAGSLKKKFTEMIWGHSNALMSLIVKKRMDFQIQHAFSYMTWSQLYLLSKDFYIKFEKIRELYNNDPLFQKYAKMDAKDFGKKLDDNQINFFLEENILFYLMLKGQIKLPNEYIQKREKWLLIAYPGNPIRSLVYLFQKNFFKLPRVQIYEGWYNLETKLFVDFEDVDLETYSVK
jgi:hypothetical protein